MRFAKDDLGFFGLFRNTLIGLYVVNNNITTTVPIGYLASVAVTVRFSVMLSVYTRNNIFIVINGVVQYLLGMLFTSVFEVNLFCLYYALRIIYMV